MIGARAVKCLVSRDWFILALFAVSVSDCVSVGPTDGVEEKLVSIPIDSSNPDIIPITQLSPALDSNAGKELAKNNTYAFEYSKGFRMPGDELLVFDSRSFQFPVQDISLTIFYPKMTTNEKQFLITAFRMKVHQDSPEGDGYLTSGGIRQEYLGLRIVAAKATAFSYDIAIYGILHDLLSPDYNPGIIPSDAVIFGDHPQKLVTSSVKVF